MDDRTIQWRVGILILTSIVLTAVLVLFFGESPTNPFRPRRTISADFTQVQGVTPNAPVRRLGKRIGKVTRVELRDNVARVYAEVNADYALRQNETLRIVSMALLGDSFLEIVRKDGGVDQPFAADADDIHLGEGLVSTQTDELMDVVLNVARKVSDMEDDITLALNAVKSAGTEFEEVAQNVNEMFENNQGQLKQLFEDTDDAIKKFDQTMTDISGFVGDEQVQKDVKDTIQMMPTFVKKAEDAVNTINQVGSRLNANLDNLVPFTERLGERGPSLIDDTQRSIRRFDDTLAQFSRLGSGLGSGLESSQGSLGMFLTDPELYIRLTSAISKFETLMDRSRPIVESLVIFSDKIARDPGRIGAKGMLDRSASGGKWLVPH